jgi:hypothetical protein
LKEPDSKCNGRKAGERGYCKQTAGHKTWHPGVGRCRLHGGASPTYTAEVYRLRAEQAIIKYSLPVETDPHTALIQELERTQGIVRFLEYKINQLEDTGKDANMVGPVGGAQGGFPEFKPNVYWVMFQHERKHLLDVGKTCIAAGIEERRVRLAEQQGELIAAAIRGILKDLGVADDERAPGVVRRHLQLVSSPNEEEQAA